jgi:hypothetical protein
MRTAIVASLLLCLTLSSGCWFSGSRALTGLAYTNIKVPFSEGLVKTPIVTIHAGGDTYEVREPFSGLGMYAKWNSNAIGDIAKRYGIKKVYYSDVEILNILRIWKREKIHIYGE